MEFTKGNWYADCYNTANDFVCEVLVIPDGNDLPETICHFDNSNAIDYKEAEANAKLIAAAPDMYEVLEQVWNHDLEMPQALQAQIILALQKVRGEL